MDITELDMSMIEAPRGPIPEGEVDMHKPYTTSERFEQLKEIDDDIITLLEHASRTVQALTKPPLADASSANNADGQQAAPDSDPFDPEAQVVAYKAAMYDFVATLDSVDKRLKRQFYGLEEAGILTLKAPETKVGERPKPSLKPDGEGKIGGLDVGRLNAGGPKVERAMEKELWAKASQHLNQVAEKRMVP